jgi:predicted NBD/HSP70 family sugar kinase
MAAAEPHRYVVVDADGSPDEVAERVAAGLAPLLPPRLAGESKPVGVGAPGRGAGDPSVGPEALSFDERRLDLDVAPRDAPEATL